MGEYMRRLFNLFLERNGGQKAKTSLAKNQNEQHVVLPSVPGSLGRGGVMWAKQQPWSPGARSDRIVRDMMNPC
jgi:hypothetical protein